MALSKRIRYEILKRDNHACRYCGATAPEAKLTVDHVLPTALGGTDTPDNLVAACHDCNAGKSSTSPTDEVVAQVADDAFRWAAAIKQAAQAMEAETEARYAANSAFHELWIENVHKWNGEPAYRPADWAETLDTFRSRGLAQSELEDALWVALAKGIKDDTWRYFCGICWRKIEKLQAMAEAIVAEGATA